MNRLVVVVALCAGCFNYEGLSSGLDVPHGGDLGKTDDVLGDGGAPAADLSPVQLPDMTPPPPLLDDCSDKINGTPCGPSTCYTNTTVPKINEYICVSGGCLNRSRYCYDLVVGNYSACCADATGNAFCQLKMSTTCD